MRFARYTAYQGSPRENMPWRRVGGVWTAGPGGRGPVSVRVIERQHVVVIPWAQRPGSSRELLHGCTGHTILPFLRPFPTLESFKKLWSHPQGQIKLLEACWKIHLFSFQKAFGKQGYCTRPNPWGSWKTDGRDERIGGVLPIGANGRREGIIVGTAD